MAISALNLVFLAREQLTELPESVIFSRENLTALIPSAITVWQERTSSNTDKRQNFIVESDDIEIVGNVADITAAVEAKGYKLEYIRSSDINFDYDGVPNFNVRFFASSNRSKLRGRQDKFFICAYLSGKKITFVHPSEESFDASFKLRSVVLPNTLDEIPSSLAPEIALIIAEIAKGQFRQQNRGLDKEG